MSSLKPVGSRQTAVVRRLDLGEGIQLQVLRFKSSQGNFRINIPKFEARASCAMIPRDIIEQKAYLIWERKGRPTNPPQDKEVLLKNVSSESHIILAVNLKGYTVLHWGVSRTSAGEWLVSGEGNKIEICKWLLDEIAQREKDAERSLMHR
ncbi:hypothetical protein BHM03_00041834 [Ensete ventricosum]|nr:hypothetical protein BHM03_00041834 [Ensete ventricosum]